MSSTPPGWHVDGYRPRPPDDGLALTEPTEAADVPRTAEPTAVRSPAPTLGAPAVATSVSERIGGADVLPSAPRPPTGARTAGTGGGRGSVFAAIGIALVLVVVGTVYVTSNAWVEGPSGLAATQEAERAASQEAGEAAVREAGRAASQGAQRAASQQPEPLDDAERDAAVTAVQLYSDSWQQADCEKFRATTTPQMRLRFNAPDCQEFAALAAEQGFPREDFGVTVRSVERAGDEIVVVIEQRWSTQAADIVTEDVYSLVEREGAWLVDGDT